jgi:ribokinase
MNNIKILNFGSINIDYVYEVNHFVRPGETIASQKFQTYIGGKGCNQSVAIAKAGFQVFHAGNISETGTFIKTQLEKWKVDTTFIKVVKTPTGHAIIQVNQTGENAIIIHGGANQTITSNQIEETLEHFNKGDFLLIQNEINHIPLLIQKAKEKEMVVIFNPAPMTKNVLDYPLELIDILIVNQTEAAELSNQKGVENILKYLTNQFPKASFILTLGEQGSIFIDGQQRIETKAEKVEVKDTTAAGDTFIGYFLAEIARNIEPTTALKLATKAAAITVSKKGGAISIPNRNELI